MKKLVILIVSIIALIGVLIGAAILYDKLSANYHPNMEQTSQSGESQQQVKAPDFTAYDKDGNAVSLSDFKGKPVVLNFWASWCGPCQHEMPDFEEAYKQYGDEVVFMMVNMTDGMRETQSTAETFVKQAKFTFPVYYDLDIDAARIYKVMSMPTTYFVDEEGYLRSYRQGMIDKSGLEYGISMITK